LGKINRLQPDLIVAVVRIYCFQ